MGHRIGIVGYGNQGKRTEKILKKIGFTIDVIYKPSASVDDQICTSNYEKLKQCNTIFICSPNDSHFKYIMEFHKTSYIFCEKTPVSNLQHLKTLKSLNHDMIFYNFNMRYTHLANTLDKMSSYGQIIGGFICLTHGLAGEQKYLNSWRSHLEQCPKGVFEVISIHAIDLIKTYYNDASLFSNKLLNLSQNGSAPDTSNSTLSFKNNAKVNILASYFAPYNFEWNIIFENALFRANDKKIEILGPRRTFDKNKFFVKPKTIEKIEIKRSDDYEHSLTKSISHFMDHVINKKKFNKILSDTSLISNQMILE